MRKAWRQAAWCNSRSLLHHAREAGAIPTSETRGGRNPRSRRPRQVQELSESKQCRITEKKSKNCNLGGVSIMVTTQVAKEGQRFPQGEEKATEEEAISKSPNYK